jgi:threonine/homoserine/homoserine lactone efflux protein
VVSPGASFAITVSSLLAGDKRAPVKVWVGTALGIFLVAAVAAFSGLGRLLAVSGTSRTIFGLIGGLVLVAIGISSLVRVVRPKQIAEQNPSCSSGSHFSGSQ